MSGRKQYELTNHLGNVLATIGDQKLPVDTNGGGTDFYSPIFISAQDYYPFGMLMPGRNDNVGKYRFGFNGKENDNEVKGEGNQQDYGMRIYDTRLGKFLSIDPLTPQYAELTPYQFATNNPIFNIDIDGLEGTPPKEKKDGNTTTAVVSTHVSTPDPNLMNVKKSDLNNDISSFFKSVDSKLMGNASFSFGVSLVDESGKSDGKSSNPVSGPILEINSNVVTIIEDIANLGMSREVNTTKDQRAQNRKNIADERNTGKSSKTHPSNSEVYNAELPDAKPTLKKSNDTTVQYTQFSPWSGNIGNRQRSAQPYKDTTLSKGGLLKMKQNPSVVIRPAQKRN